MAKYRKKPVVIEAVQTNRELDIETLEGAMHANVGDGKQIALKSWGAFPDMTPEPEPNVGE